MDYKVINSNKIPMVGFGTWRISDSEAEDAVGKALRVGYRHIDTASIYKNENGVGKGIHKSGVAREEIFLTTKVWLETNSYKGVLKEFESSCKKLQTDYIDLYLIHWPTKNTANQWKALEELYDLKKVRSIGVCNFNEYHLEELSKYSRYKPTINQIEIHPLLNQKPLIAYNKQHDIVTEAWSPLMKGRILEYSILHDLAKNYNRTEAQITLRWHLQNDIVVIPKTIHQHRMEENINVFDFTLSDHDMSLLDDLNKDDRVGGNPDTYAKEKFNQ